MDPPAVSTAPERKIVLNYTGDKQPPPLAIIGIGCRFPGDVIDTNSFWSLLCEGKDAITEIPPERWTMDYHNPDNKVLGKHINTACGFTTNINKFDPSFFGISPREAHSIDPQQRKLLEVTWEAFEDAGIVPSELNGSNTGVFVGIGMIDYYLMQMDPVNINMYTATGVAHSVAANRISYAFGLKGPSMAVDTACASSMTALHYGALSLWNDEVDLAVVSGANALLSGDVTVGFSKLGVLSPDSRSKAFDASANGYVRGEGFGTVLVKRLDQAIADGDYVYASIIGTAVGHNGKTDSITMPSGEAQEDLSKWLCQRYNVDSGKVSYVEAHGTGTYVGDPIEGNAIVRAYGDVPTRKQPLRVGSVKSNMGHLEYAAGIASLIKVSLMLERGFLVPSIHFSAPNPALKPGGFVVQTTVEPFRSKKEITTQEEPILCAVNSFGFGGANAACILQQFDNSKVLDPWRSNTDSAALTAGAELAGWRFDDDITNTEEKNTVLIPLSAKSSFSLKEIVKQWLNLKAPVDALIVSKFQSLRRTHHAAHRLGVVASSLADFQTKLQGYVDGKEMQGLLHGQSKNNVKLGFVFSGQGPQHFDMGRVLFQHNGTFRSVVTKMDSIFVSLGGSSLIKLGLFENNNTPPNQEIFMNPAVTQPGIVFLQIGLFHVWKSFGIQPSVIVGHSIGEIAAAYASGALSLHDAVTICYYRSHHQSQVQSGLGTMLAVGVSAEKAKVMISDISDKIWIAAINSPESVTLGGDTTTIRDVVAPRFKEAGIFNSILRVSHAFHTQHMEPIKDSLLAALSDLKDKVKTPTIPIYSSVTGARYEGLYDAEYWWNNVRQPVLFYQAAQIALKGCDVIVEIAPHPVLQPSLKQILDSSAQIICTLNRKVEDRQATFAALGQLYTCGINPDWKSMLEHIPDVFVKLPLYPWQYELFWSEGETSVNNRLGKVDKSLLAHGGLLQLSKYPFMEDHVVHANLVFPGAGYIEMVLETIWKEGDFPIVLEDIRFTKALFWPPSGNLKMAVNRNGSKFEVVSIEDGTPSTHMIGTIGKDKNIKPPVFNLQEALARCGAEKLRMQECYKLFEEQGFEYGPHFQVLKEVNVGDREVVGFLQHPPDDSQKFHVTLLDGCLQMTILSADTSNTYLPVHIGKLVIYSPLGLSSLKDQNLVAYAHQTSFEGMLYLKGDVILATEDGTILATLKDFMGQCINNHTGVDVNECVYKNIWQDKELAIPPPSRSSLPDISQWKTELDLIEAVEKRLSSFEELVCGYIHSALLRVDSGEVKVHPKLLKYEAKLREIYNINSYKYNFEAVTPYSLQELAIQIHTALPQVDTETSVVTQIAAKLPEIFQDPMVAVHILYAPDTLQQFFTDSLSLRVYYEWVARAVKDTVDMIYTLYGNDRVVRIIECGARLGALTGYIAPLVAQYGNERRLEYVFGDLTNDSFANAQNRLAEYPFIKYHTIDIERDPESSDQRFLNGQFDIVIALNTIHATARMDRSLTTMHTLLAPGGYLFVIDPTNVPLFADLIFGALDIWWAFNDFRLAQGHCCLSREDWCKTLVEYGFEPPVDVSTPGEWVNSIFVTRRQQPASLELFRNPRKNALGRFSAPTRFAVFSDGSDASHEFLATAGNQRCEVFKQGEADWQARFKEVLSNSTQDDNNLWGIVFMWSLPVMEPSLAMDASVGLFYVIRLLHELSIKPVSLWVVTQGVCVDGKCPSGALSIGMLRPIVNELQEIDMYSVDLEVGVAPKMQVAQLIDVIIGKFGRETELTFRDGKCRALRVLSVHYAEESKKHFTNSSNGFQLTVEERGNLDSLEFCALPNHQALQSGQVRVRVESAGFNFKDLMFALNLLEDLSQHTEKEYKLGHELSGVVEGVGAGVESLKIGDAVMGILPYGGTFASHIICEPLRLVKKPSNLSFDQAAGSTLIFATAYYALITLGRLRKGDTVLVHAATGGVGHAAIQIAHMIGAKVIGTAGSEAKRTYLLNECKVACVASSRLLGFVETVNEFTKNRGVDVVLNSLSGDAIAAGMSILAFGGRFIEIGKRDILQNNKIDLLPFLSNRSFMSAHIDIMLEKDPEGIHEVMVEVGSLLEKGVVQPPPISAYPVDKAIDVFRLVQNNQHVGKLVIQIPKEFVPAHCKPPEELYNPNAAYLITGGFGGIGLSLAVSMAERGARNLIIMGRRNPDTPKVRSILAKIQEIGCRYHLALGDISNMIDLKKAFAWAEEQGLPIRGIWHLATTLADSFLIEMTEDIFRHVFPSKVQGAWNLHQLSLDMQLDFFMMASSVSGIMGNVEQANYAAAVTYLDMLSLHRKSLGLPGTAVQMGLVRGAGMAERSRNIARIAKLRGFYSLHVSELVDMSEQFTQNQEQGIIQVGYQNWESIVKGAKDCLRGSHLLHVQKNIKTGTEGMNLEQMLELAAKQVGKTLFLEDPVATDQPLVSYGVDSMISMELVSWFKNTFNLQISQMDIFSGVSLRELLAKAGVTE